MSDGSGAPRNSCTSAKRLAEPTNTSVAPARRWVCESLPGWSMSKPSCACLTVETVRPRATKRAVPLASSVVLPEPCQPASPIMRMGHYSSARKLLPVVPAEERVKETGFQLGSFSQPDMARTSCRFQAEPTLRLMAQRTTRLLSVDRTPDRAGIRRLWSVTDAPPSDCGQAHATTPPPGP